ARHRPAVESVVNDLLNSRRVEDRNHHVHEVELGLMRRGGRFGRMVIAHQSYDAAMTGGAGEVGMADRVAGTVDAWPFAIPHAEHAIEPALAAQLGLLRASQCGGGKILVGSRVELDVVSGEYGAGAHELLVEGAERRTPIARHVARRV